RRQTDARERNDAEQLAVRGQTHRETAGVHAAKCRISRVRILHDESRGRGEGDEQRDPEEQDERQAGHCGLSSHMGRSFAAEVGTIRATGSPARMTPRPTSPMSSSTAVRRDAVIDLLASQRRALHIHEIATRLGVEDIGYDALRRLLDDLSWNGS